jgi:hypothetical protein
MRVIDLVSHRSQKVLSLRGLVRQGTAESRRGDVAHGLGGRGVETRASATCDRTALSLRQQCPDLKWFRCETMMEASSVFETQIRRKRMRGGLE